MSRTNYSSVGTKIKTNSFSLIIQVELSQIIQLKMGEEAQTIYKHTNRTGRGCKGW